MILDADRERLVAACRQLAEAGLSPGSSGNVSLRAGERVLVTPTGSSLRRVAPEELALAGIDGAVEPGPAPTKELAMHLAVYRRRPEASAVVHLHSPAATAVSCLPVVEGADPLPALTPYRVMRLGRVAVAPYAAPGTEALAAGVETRAEAHAVLLLAQHGSLVAAPSLEAAVELSEELEAAAQLTLLLRDLGARELDETQQRELRR